MTRVVVDKAAAVFDRAFAAAVLNRSAASRAASPTEGLSHAERLVALDHVQRTYASCDPVFRTPEPINPDLARVRTAGDVDVFDATWPSAYAVHAPEVAERYERPRSNSRAAARLFLRRGSPRPVAILIHGYRCGQYPLEERVWPIRWFAKRGMDVALAVLPFHAVRSEQGAPLFPGSDPRITIEGFRQAMLDLRGLVDFLLRRGAPAVGAMGMSLGGYSTSLLATVEPRLAFAAPMIPLASVADVARDGGRLVGSVDEQRLQYEGLVAALRPVSPLTRPLVVPADRVRIIAARSDRITPPLHHAERLASHFGVPVHVVSGGHILQLGRRHAFRIVGNMLDELGLTS